MKPYLFLLFLIANFSPLCAQSYDNTVILDMQIAGGKTTMIDYNGKVMKVFSDEEKVKVTEETFNTFTSLSMFSSFVVYNFDDGPLPVQVGKNWYLYDKSGKMVQDFGNRFFSLTKPSEGIYRVYEPIEGKNGSYMSVSYKHLRAHETVLDLVCRLLLEKKKTHIIYTISSC